MGKIEKLSSHFVLKQLALDKDGRDLYELKEPSQKEIVAKINEIIDYINDYELLKETSSVGQGVMQEK